MHRFQKIIDLVGTTALASTTTKYGTFLLALSGHPSCGLLPVRLQPSMPVNYAGFCRHAGVWPKVYDYGTRLSLPPLLMARRFLFRRAPIKAIHSRGTSGIYSRLLTVQPLVGGPSRPRPLNPWQTRLGVVALQGLRRQPAPKLVSSPL